MEYLKCLTNTPKRHFHVGKTPFPSKSCQNTLSLKHSIRRVSEITIQYSIFSTQVQYVPSSRQSNYIYPQSKQP